MLTFADESLLGQALCALLAKSKLVDTARYCGRLEKWEDAVLNYVPNTVVWLGTYADRATLDIVGAIRDRYPDLVVCLVTERVETIALRDVIRDGAERLGVLRRTASLDAAHVLKSLLQLASGPATLSSEILEQLVADVRSHGDEIDSLSDSEHAVLSLLASGLRNREIARRTRMSEKLVERHVTRIFAKLGLRRDNCELDRRVTAARLFFFRTAHPQG